MLLLVLLLQKHHSFSFFHPLPWRLPQALWLGMRLQAALLARQWVLQALALAQAPGVAASSSLPLSAREVPLLLALALQAPPRLQPLLPAARDYCCYEIGGLWWRLV
jgi:hypothetical protein